MRRFGWSAFLCAASLVLGSCTGGDTAHTDARPTLALAKVFAHDGVLELPLLQSGSQKYADVRIALRDDGTFSVVSGRLFTGTTGGTLPDGVLEPATALDAIARSTEALSLRLRRVHLHSAVYEAVVIELKSGRWRHIGTPARAAALTSSDFERNPHLRATGNDLLALRSEPGKTQSVPIHLEGRDYRFCMEAQAEGADELAIVDKQGRVLARTRAGEACMTVSRAAGTYRLRHTYGGKGAPRMLFVRGQAPQSPQASATATPREYWAIMVTMTGKDSQGNDTVAFNFLTSYSNTFLDCQPFLSPNPSLMVGGFMTDYAAAGNYTFFGPQAHYLFDTLNFFTPQFGSNGALTGLGGSPDCGGNGVYVLQGSSPQYVGLAPADNPGPTPLVIDGWDGVGTFFNWKAAGSLQPVGFPRDPILDGAYSTVGPMQPIATGTTPPYQIESYRVVLRYRPDGVGALKVRQAALFNSSDCTGPAMVIDTNQVNLLTGGPMGDFRGSLLLGPDTAATIWSGLGAPVASPLNAESAPLTRLGCIANALQTASWAAQSIELRGPDINYTSTDGCVNCNLTHLDFTGNWLANSDFSGTNFSFATLNNAYLNGSILRSAVLQNAKLQNANLDGANLCNAFLNAPPTDAATATVAADLTGAFLRNVNLANANLDGTTFSNASFFGEEAIACPVDPSNSCASTAVSYCASAYNAVLNNTGFSGAYLANTDFSGATGTADFSNAVLVSARFVGARLDANGGTATRFGGASLMGADFSGGATATGASFGGAYATSLGGCQQYMLGTQLTSFTGFTARNSSGSCVAAAPAPSCQQVNWNAKPLPPGAAQALPPSGSTTAACQLLCPTDPFTGIGMVNTCFQRTDPATNPPVPPPVIYIEPLPSGPPGGVTS